MAWIMTPTPCTPHLVTAVVTGKPMALGGSRGRPSHRRGCMIVILKALELLASSRKMRGW